MGRIKYQEVKEFAKSDAIPGDLSLSIQLDRFLTNNSTYRVKCMTSIHEQFCNKLIVVFDVYDQT